MEALYNLTKEYTKTNKDMKLTDTQIRSTARVLMSNYKRLFLDDLGETDYTLLGEEIASELGVQSETGDTDIEARIFEIATEY